MNESKTKICVYAICKNEEKHINRWVESLREADKIVVLDTGSTDNTVELLRQYSPFLTVSQKIINPWRFDVARNESLKLVPQEYDICVVSDLDQIFRPGWADELRRLYNKGYQEIYGDIIDYDNDNHEIKRFLSKNVHPNDPRWYWERPIHEGILYHGDDTPSMVESDVFVIEHHPDTTKSRDGYLELLETEYNENSSDPMCAIYYGCELCFHDRNQEGLDVFLKAIKECDFTKCPEIGYQININIADEYNVRGEKNNAIYYVGKAKEYGIETRRLYMKMAEIYLNSKNYENAIYYTEIALNVSTHIRSWIESDYYLHGGCYDMLALSYSGLRDYKKAIVYGTIAAKCFPSDERITNNLSCYIEEYKKEVK